MKYQIYNIIQTEYNGRQNTKWMEWNMKQCNDRERWIHQNMAVIGGFMGGYAILNHHELFGSAQTANMISIAMDAAGRLDADFAVRVLGLLVYMAGLASTVILPKLNLNLKLFSVCLDAAALVLVGLLPDDLNDFIALYPLFFASSVQWCSFKGADGFVSASIFSTNNLRQITTSFTEYICSRDREALRKGKFYGKVLLFFHSGVAAAFLSCQAFGLKGAWVGIVPVCTAFAQVCIDCYGGACETEELAAQ